MKTKQLSGYSAAYSLNLLNLLLARATYSWVLMVWEACLLGLQSSIVAFVAAALAMVVLLVVLV